MGRGFEEVHRQKNMQTSFGRTSYRRRTRSPSLLWLIAMVDTLRLFWARGFQKTLSKKYSLSDLLTAFTPQLVIASLKSASTSSLRVSLWARSWINLEVECLSFLQEHQNMRWHPTPAWKIFSISWTNATKLNVEARISQMRRNQKPKSFKSP